MVPSVLSNKVRPVSTNPAVEILKNRVTYLSEIDRATLLAERNGQKFPKDDEWTDRDIAQLRERLDRFGRDKAPKVDKETVRARIVALNEEAFEKYEEYERFAKAAGIRNIANPYISIAELDFLREHIAEYESSGEAPKTQQRAASSSVPPSVEEGQTDTAPGPVGVRTLTPSLREIDWKAVAKERGGTTKFLREVKAVALANNLEAPKRIADLDRLPELTALLCFVDTEASEPQREGTEGDATEGEPGTSPSESLVVITILAANQKPEAVGSFGAHQGEDISAFLRTKGVAV